MRFGSLSPGQESFRIEDVTERRHHPSEGKARGDHQVSQARLPVAPFEPGRRGEMSTPSIDKMSLRLDCYAQLRIDRRYHPQDALSQNHHPAQIYGNDISFLKDPCGRHL